jgi:predicted anti-sigma-YlaC factor YlaD
MRKNSRLFKSATKFLPVLHGQYREMCSLAAVGQLGGPQMCELNEHIASCNSCRRFLESIARASVEVLPVLAEERISGMDAVPPHGMRARFLARLADEKRGYAAGDCRSRVKRHLIRKRSLSFRG